MRLKEMLKKDFSKAKIITLERYKAAQFTLIITSFLFFLNFYFVGAKFYLNVFSNTLGITYILLLLSFVFYVHFYIKHMLIEKVKRYYFIIILVLLFIIFTVFVSPLIFDEGVKGFFGLFKFYF